jgi:CMP-N,N'-diacetyllegionaminic acid synthase
VKILAFIPARSGSETVGMKNMLRLDGMPLVGWALRAACQSNAFDSIVVSTDHETIKDYCNSNYKEAIVVDRPEHLRDGRSYPIQDVVIDYLKGFEKADRPNAVALFQPTSPFIRQYQIEHLANQLTSVNIRSSYTICPVPHNMHWINQRETKNGKVNFLFSSKRATAWNKQKKNKAHMFGNLVMTKTRFLRSGFFPTPSAYLEIDRFDSIDIDGIDDYEYAKVMLKAGHWENGDR